ncbi:SsrA-binding protein SmpB [Patescibacteria group bacterium]|nr:SsrA-binding protein SmpB [Patescibacteria group bacterium]
MKVFNRQFSRNFEKLESYEAGVSLLGAEVKSIRTGNVRLEDAFVRLTNEEAFLVNADVPIYRFSRPQGYDSRRTRKLLLHRDQLIRLKTKLASVSRLAIVPVACYTKGHLVKLEIALAKGRRTIEKKKLEKQRDIKRQEEKKIKEYLRN